MIKKLVKHGNSVALILDKPILDLLKIEMNSKVEITTDGTNLIISPVADDDPSLIRESIEKINRKHADTLRKLAG